MTPRPDFLRPVRKPNRLAHVACWTALGVLALASWDAAMAWSGLRQAQAAQALRATPPRPSASAVAPEALRAAAATRARLARPWAQTFEALEATPTRGAFWLALDVDERGRVRLEGVAADEAAALSIASRLQREGPWHEVLVTRIEKPGPQGRRFTLAATAAEGAW